MVIPASPLVNQQPHLPQQQQQQPVVENPAAFVKAHLSGGGSAVELAPLKSQLSSTLSHLKTQLTDLINRDYEDFINLGI